MNEKEGGNCNLISLISNERMCNCVCIMCPEVDKSLFIS